MNNPNKKIKIWSEFTDKGKEFWIQDVQDEYFDIIANAMSSDFIKDEPLGYYGKVFEDSIIVEKQKQNYYQTLRKCQSIMCMTRDEFGNPTPAGVHCQEISSYPMEETFFFGRTLLVYMLQFNNILSELAVNKFSLDKGLFVFSKYRGYGIGRQLLKCWPLICKEANVEVGVGIFSSKYSQTSAKRAGLIELKYLPYKDIRNDCPKEIPLGIEEHTEGLKLYCVYPSI
ncbi:hypothetical protein FQR65_LT03763 [Abscondita terminalis]|nr:hypothetical protein FQR65_LT03763 [Abscondita terminalis]